MATIHIHGQKLLHHIYPDPVHPVSTDQTSGTCAELTGMLQRHLAESVEQHVPKVLFPYACAPIFLWPRYVDHKEGQARSRDPSLVLDMFVLGLCCTLKCISEMFTCGVVSAQLSLNSSHGQLFRAKYVCSKTLRCYVWCAYGFHGYLSCVSCHKEVGFLSDALFYDLQ
jgi:hypothetical protein